MSLGDYQVNQNRIQTRGEKKLSAIDKVVRWDRIVVPRGRDRLLTRPIDILVGVRGKSS